jgi:hypothetical protein
VFEKELGGSYAGEYGLKIIATFHTSRFLFGHKHDKKTTSIYV